MTNFELEAFNAIMNIQTIMPFTMIGTFAILGVLKLLQKRIEKIFQREESCKLWEEIVCGGYETVPSTNHSGDITK